MYIEYNILRIINYNLNLYIPSSTLKRNNKKRHLKKVKIQVSIRVDVHVFSIEYPQCTNK